MARVARVTLAGCLLLVLALPGCAAVARTQRTTAPVFYPHAMEAGLGQTSKEHYHQVLSIAAHDGRSFVDDLDLLFQTERPSRLSRWLSR